MKEHMKLLKERQREIINNENVDKSNKSCL